MANNSVPKGTIEQKEINAAHVKIKNLVDRFDALNDDVTRITNDAKSCWVGQGRNEFEMQYNILISKIDDFGDSLVDIRDALIKAEASYIEVNEDLYLSYSGRERMPMSSSGKF